MKIILSILILFFIVSCKKDTKQVPVLAFVVNTRAAGDAPFILRPPQSNSGGAFTYTSDNPAVAAISGSEITIKGTGSANITAVQVASADYREAKATAVFTVVPAGTIVAGQVYAGGIVVHLLTVSGVVHGYVVSEEDISVSSAWTNGSLLTTTATSAAIGGGMANTTKIIAALGEGTYAAKLCVNYRGGGFTDWFLPSSGELALVAARKNLVGGISETNYWSSTEAATVANANFVFMGPGNTAGISAFSKVYQYKVKAFRYF